MSEYQKAVADDARADRLFRIRLFVALLWPFAVLLAAYLMGWL